MSFFEFPHTRTYDSDLGWLIKHVNSYDETIAALNQWIETNEPRMEEIEAFIAAMNSAATLPPGVKQALYDWASQNLIELIGAAIKNVFFGLNDEGYFVAYIPESWEDITFNTSDYDIWLTAHPEVDYGHLILSY